MVGLAYRLRVMGSLALSLCHLAAGRVDAVCSLKPARAVDIAAAQLLVRERGLAIDLPEAPPFGDAPLDVEGRSRVVAAATPEVCDRLFAALVRVDPGADLRVHLLAQRVEQREQRRERREARRHQCVEHADAHQHFGRLIDVRHVADLCQQRER